LFRHTQFIIKTLHRNPKKYLRLVKTCAMLKRQPALAVSLVILTVAWLVPPEYSIALILLTIFGNRRTYNQGLKPPNNPTHSTTRRQAISPNPFHHITNVESSGPSGVIGISSPEVSPPLAPDRANILPASSEGVSYSSACIALENLMLSPTASSSPSMVWSPKEIQSTDLSHLTAVTRSIIRNKAFP